MTSSWLSPKVISTLGFGTALAVYLVYILVQLVLLQSPKIEKIDAALATYAAVDADAHTKTSDVMEANVKLLRGICINTADGDKSLLINCNL